jgi:multiple antibiotic resistance protein
VVLARRVAFYSTLVMLVTLWAGSYILSFFGISLNALRIAGGIVVSTRAYEMLAAPEVTVDRKQAEAAPVEPTSDPSGFAFFPLTLPFTTGPGTIAVAISLGTERPEGGVAGMLLYFGGASIAVLAMAVLIWLSYTTADRLAAVLGASGRNVVARLAALLLLAIGVQIVLSGAVPALHGAFTGKDIHF